MIFPYIPNLSTIDYSDFLLVLSVIWKLLTFNQKSAIAKTQSDCTFLPEPPFSTSILLSILSYLSKRTLLSLAVLRTALCSCCDCVCKRQDRYIQRGRKRKRKREMNGFQLQHILYIYVHMHNPILYILPWQRSPYYTKMCWHSELYLTFRITFVWTWSMVDWYEITSVLSYLVRLENFNCIVCLRTDLFLAQMEWTKLQSKTTQR